MAQVGNVMSCYVWNDVISGVISCILETMFKAFQDVVNKNLQDSVGF